MYRMLIKVARQFVKSKCINIFKCFIPLSRPPDSFHFAICSHDRFCVSLSSPENSHIKVPLDSMKIPNIPIFEKTHDNFQRTRCIPCCALSTLFANSIDSQIFISDMYVKHNLLYY